jgi:hypothetical protein
MYCPRCGTQAIETTKFCRSCGLAMTPVTTYVATGGTAPLTSPLPTDDSPLSTVKGFWQKLPPNQQMIASILAFIFAVPFLGVFAGGRLAGMAAILMPLGIVWSVLYFRAKQRESDQRRFQSQPPPQMYTPPTPTTTQQPAYQVPPVRTNPLADTPPQRPTVPNSVTEEETQRLPKLPRQME